MGSGGVRPTCPADQPEVPLGPTRTSRSASGSGCRKGGDAPMQRIWNIWNWADRIIERVNRAEGQGLAEYALILALIAIVAIVSLLFLGGQISKILSNVGKSV